MYKRKTSFNKFSLHIFRFENRDSGVEQIKETIKGKYRTITFYYTFEVVLLLYWHHYYVDRSIIAPYTSTIGTLKNIAIIYEIIKRSPMLRPFSNEENLSHNVH